MPDKKKKPASGKKERIKSAPGASLVKKQIDELTKQRDEIQDSYSLMKIENEQLRDKVKCIMEKIVENTDKKQNDISDETDLVAIGTDDCLEMISKVIMKGEKDADTIESRVEELETRVTKQSMDVVTLTKRALLLEYGLEDTLKCKDQEEVKARVKACLLLLGDPLPEALITPRPQSANIHKAARPQSAVRNRQSCQHHPVIENGITRSQLILDCEEDERLNDAAYFHCHQFTEDEDDGQPAHKGPGETHIRFMNRELKRHVAKDLSQEKPSGADWRMLAERVGISDEKIKRWRNMRLECPMAMVFSDWGESPGATIRILHRHIISPQMRCPILGRKITDFYDVD